MLLWSALLPILSLTRAVTAAEDDSFHESLTLHPLPDGKLSVLFEFTTHFTSRKQANSRIGQSHHSLTPPSLLLPLEHNDVSELQISFVSGQWNQRRSGESGPLHYESGGGGGEVRGWLRDTKDGRPDYEAWTRVTHALGGLFCAGLGPSEDEDHDGESVNTMRHIYPPYRSLTNTTHFYLPQPNLHLCTENLTPFLSLLPSKGVSGLSSLLAQPDLIFAWGFKSEGIEVIMPSPESPQGRWRGWWEGVVDLIPPKHKGGGTGSRSFSIQSLFRKGLPEAFPEADSSELRVIYPSEEDSRFKIDSTPTGDVEAWMDGRKRRVAKWDLLRDQMPGRDIRFSWEGEDTFHHPRHFVAPPVTVSRTVINPFASDGTFSVIIDNTGDETRQAVYSEIWPWWLQTWLHEVSVSVDGHSRGDLINHVFYEPSTPPKVSTTTLHFSLTIPPKSTLSLKIPFTKLTLKYTEHRPDAERGREVPSGILTFLDLESEQSCFIDSTTDTHDSNTNRNVTKIRPRCSGREHLYTTRRLMDLPTPDFSMPYNVIIMSSTVMAVFFGLMHGALTRKWGLVEVEVDVGQDQESNGDENGTSDGAAAGTIREKGE